MGIPSILIFLKTFRSLRQSLFYAVFKAGRWVLFKKILFISTALLILGSPGAFAQSVKKIEEVVGEMKKIENWSIELMYENQTTEIKTLSDGTREVTVRNFGYSDMELMILKDVIYTMNNQHGFNFFRETKEGYGGIKLHVVFNYSGSSYPL